MTGSTGEKICGLKTTHDGALAVVDGGRLLISVEAEKVGNSQRHAHLGDLEVVADQLAANGIDPGEVRVLALDGWRAASSSAARQIADASGHPVPLALAGYTDLTDERFRADPFAEVSGHLPLGGRDVPYRSYPHAIDHAFAAYCTSPFAERRAPALILVWDAGTPALLYRFDPVARRLDNLGFASEMSGFLYPVFASSLEPFRAYWLKGMDGIGPGDGDPEDEALWRWSLSLPGKAMAYAGLGQVEEAALEAMASTAPAGSAQPGPIAWTVRCRRKLDELRLPDASLMASFQEFLYRELERGLRRRLDELEATDGRLPLCFAGGCALNIKFNARLRASGLFTEVWVPPFPNDSGSALGAACTEMVRTTDHVALEWSVFAGPRLAAADDPLPGWERRPCSLTELAEVLHREGEPVVLLAGRAEAGPRALGHRSIVAPAVDEGMRDHLNRIKAREPYRPVAPMCLEQSSRTVFSPGGHDPYMLFDHDVRPTWRARVPAIVHADGSARLQTVGPDNEVLFALLTAYERLSGIPVLCNTSANLPGCGFFPDAASAMTWGRTRYVWAEHWLYTQSIGDV